MFFRFYAPKSRAREKSQRPSHGMAFVISDIVLIQKFARLVLERIDGLIDLFAGLFGGAFFLATGCAKEEHSGAGYDKQLFPHFHLIELPTFLCSLHSRMITDIAGAFVFLLGKRVDFGNGLGRTS